MTAEKEATRSGHSKRSGKWTRKQPRGQPDRPWNLFISIAEVIREKIFDRNLFKFNIYERVRKLYKYLYYVYIKPYLKFCLRLIQSYSKNIPPLPHKEIALPA